MRRVAKERKKGFAGALAAGVLLVWAFGAVAQDMPGRTVGERSPDAAPLAPAVGDRPAEVARLRAQAGPVVLELYTSQGCVSCPPADRMLATLIDRDDVIPLALHVDYWDYIGWADAFADPEHGERQKRYARRHGHSTIYTPQVVINGVDIMEGFRVMQVMDAIEAHRRAAPVATVRLTRGGDGQMQIDAEALDEPLTAAASRALARSGDVLAVAQGDDPLPTGTALDVQMIRYMPRAMTEITAGENAGLTAEYVNIVTSWQTIGTWDSSAPLHLSVSVTGDQPVVVVIQQPGQGAIVAAGQLR